MSTEYPLNDVGNGQRFTRDWRTTVRWIIEDQEWRVWVGTHWQAHRSNERVLALAKITAARIWDEASAITDDTKRQRTAGWAHQSHSVRSHDSMVKMAKSEGAMWSAATDFDQDPFLLNFTNGTVDLRTGLLRQHDPEDRISCLIPFPYDPNSEAPQWERLVARCTMVDPTGQTAEFLQRVLGYMLLGRNFEQRMILFVGPKRTGKSKIVEIVARLLGPDYAWTSQPKLVTRNRWNTHHDSEMWSIRNKRYICISETDAAMDLDEAQVKNLTGASTVSVRRLHAANEVQAFVTWSIIVGTNEEPNVERWDDAIARRMVKIPSGPSLDPSEVDLDLEDKILGGEAQGVLAWLVAGAVRWWQLKDRDGTGLAMPDAVAAATQEFENANDHVAEFIDARIDIGDGFSVSATELNKAYQQHRGKGPDTLKSRALYARVLEYFAERNVPVTKDARTFHGIHLATTSVEPWMERAGRSLAGDGGL